MIVGIIEGKLPLSRETEDGSEPSSFAWPRANSAPFVDDIEFQVGSSE
jgi:hypothetical protein